MFGCNAFVHGPKEHLYDVSDCLVLRFSYCVVLLVTHRMLCHPYCFVALCLCHALRAKKITAW